ncbi:thymidine phosphorylase family protein [Hyphococcus sp.]|jgi:thymidine phosphorylase|uniref:thymidine phosphorylase family protein n=1 Tax=Hyphococcus sp. TaxID=2038636 RepID=UPI003D0A755F
MTIEASNVLRAKRLGIDTHQEAVIYMRRDCHVCRAEGFSAQARIRVASGASFVIATVNLITGELLASGEAGLSEAAWRRLECEEGALLRVSHARPLDSLSDVRAKVYGREFENSAISRIMRDIVEGRYSDIHLSSFITACAARGLNEREVIHLTRAMVAAGERLDWGVPLIVDKHCVGGLPGNRTTPIVVAIAAACGLTMPKTSSRAITSPAGTADTMETLAPVDLDLNAMRQVVEKEGGCIVWGGAVDLSPADDTLIRVERALDIDSEGQLVASVLSKKAAAGATHLVIDMPVGPTAKVRTDGDAVSLKTNLLKTAEALAIKTRVIQTDGRQPVGRGIGPSLEAQDVLKVLRQDAEAPEDLRRRAVALAGALLELSGVAAEGEGERAAAAAIADGRAWVKFQAICDAQGGMREPPQSAYQHPILADHGGLIEAIDNRRLAKAAKLAGAPDAKAAGLELHGFLGQRVETSEPLFTLHAETRGEIEYAIEYLDSHPPIFEIEA